MTNPSDYQRLISPVLREARRHAGMDGAQLASVLGLSPATVSRWETSDMDGSMPVHRLYEVAEATGLGVEIVLRPGPHACRFEIDNDSLVDTIRRSLPSMTDADRHALLLLVEFAVRRHDERLKIAANGQ